MATIINFKKKAIIIILNNVVSFFKKNVGSDMIYSKKSCQKYLPTAKLRVKKYDKNVLKFI